MIKVGKAGINGDERVTVKVKEGFRITTQLMYDITNNIFEPKPVSLPPQNSCIVQTFSYGARQRHPLSLDRFRCIAICEY